MNSIYNTNSDAGTYNNSRELATAALSPAPTAAINRLGVKWTAAPSTTIGATGVSSVTSATTIGALTGPFYLGNQNGATGSSAGALNGAIRSIAFYNSVLSSASFSSRLIVGAPY